jgi:hypothetical protein
LLPLRLDSVSHFVLLNVGGIVHFWHFWTCRDPVWAIASGSYYNNVYSSATCLPIVDSVWHEADLTFYRRTFIGFESQSDHMSAWEKLKCFTLFDRAGSADPHLCRGCRPPCFFSSVATFVVFVWETGSLGSLWSKFWDDKFMV